MGQRKRAGCSVTAWVITLAIASRAWGLPQAPPATDVWIGQLHIDSAPAGISEARNLTHRAGYDNQPAFEPEGARLLYTSQRGEQTDIYRIDLDTLTSNRLTQTPESEYSPTVMPEGRELSVVRVEADGTQRLWAFDRDGGSGRLLLPDIAPVGYHAWGGADSVVLFVLGEPATLQLVDTTHGGAEIVARDVGRSLHAMPGGGYSFLQRIDDVWRIRALDPVSGAMTDLGRPLPESQDMAWTPDGRMLMASGARVFVARPQGEWELLADLTATGVTRITRLAVDGSGTRIAWVAVRSEPGSKP